MGKNPTVIELFKRKADEISQKLNVETPRSPTPPATESSPSETRPAKVLRAQTQEVEEDNSDFLERDPGKRKQIWEYPSEEKRNDVRRAYIAARPFQPSMKNDKRPGRQFQDTWYEKFPSWLKYSPEKDAAFCFKCFLFGKTNGHPAFRSFTIDGFRNWMKVNGKRCAFLMHVGKDHNSPHQVAEKDYDEFLNQSGHIPQVYAKYTPKEIADNRLRLTSTIKALRWLALQGLPMRGRDESEKSSNRGNFLELVAHQASFDDNLKRVVLGNAPGNAIYSSPDIQKQILHIFAEKTKDAIRKEIGEEKFCILVDESGDVSGKQQMAIILRFVDDMGLVKERFFSIIHVPNTFALTLKDEIFAVLKRYGFDMKNLRGQGYDGASNMRGRWNGLQALVAQDCPFDYYVHCFAHRLQLALVAAAKDVIPICQFFSKLSSVVNVVRASNKRVDELRSAFSAEISMLLEDDQLETGTGKNQASNLQRAGDTRWGSHLRSISSLIKMFSSACSVLYKLKDEGSTSSERGDAATTIEIMTSFDFIFILHLMKDTLEVSDMLSQALQRKAQDILNSLHLVESTKILLQKYRDDGWTSLLDNVKSFCERRNIEVPDMTSMYIERGGRARHQQDHHTLEHHYRVNLFYAAIDVQLQELNNRFNDKSVELLTLSCALEPRGEGKFFKVGDICDLVNKYYPEDFTDVEKEVLKVQLQHFEIEISRHPELKNWRRLLN